MSKELLFVAETGEEIAGYVAFYRKGNFPYANQFIKNKKEAYCGWTAVAKDYQGKGLATQLKLKIFDEGFECFKGHIKKTNGYCSVKKV